MIRAHICKKGLVGLLILISGTCYAQKASNAAGAVWKKTVGREIDVQEPDDEKKHHLRDLSNDTTFTELIMNAIKAGKITPYSNYDHSFTTKITLPQINNMLIRTPDTQIVVDPVTGKETTKVISYDIDYEKIHKYRILEEWAFNRQTGNTDIHIAGIAPIQDVYGETGEYRGSRPIFWIRYHELVELLNRYEQTHPGKALPSYIWNDYFLSDVKPGEKK